MWNVWQYLGHVEPVQRIERDQPIPWAAEPEVPVRTGGLPTALLVTACFLVPTPPAAEQTLAWATPQDAPVVAPTLVTPDTGAEWTPQTIQPPVTWLPELEQPDVSRWPTDLTSGAEQVIRPVVSGAGIPWSQAMSEPVWHPMPVADPETGAAQIVPPVVVVTPIPWAHQTELPTLPIPPSLYPTGGELLPVTIATETAIGWAVPLSEPDTHQTPLLYETGGERIVATVVPSDVVDRRVADFPDRAGSRSNRPRQLGPI